MQHAEPSIEMNPATLRTALEKLTTCLRDLWFLAPNTEQVDGIYNEATDIIYSLEITLPSPPAAREDAPELPFGHPGPNYDDTPPEAYDESLPWYQEPDHFFLGGDDE